MPKYDALFAETYNNIYHSFDFLRSMNGFGKPTWAAELQGGPISTGFHLGRVPSAQDIRRWMLGFVGAGITGISFWVTRAEIMAGEMNGFSLLDDEGDTSERLEEAGKAAEFLNKYPALFNAPKKQAQVGIIVDEDNYSGCSRLAQGGEGHAKSMGGWYRYMFDNNIDVDYVCVEELEEDYVNQYKMLILPFPLFMSDKTAKNLSSYANGGGLLVSEATPGRINSNGMARREKMAMRDVFGVKSKSLKMVREPGGEHRFTPHPRTWGEYLDHAEFEGRGIFEGHALTPNLYVQCFELNGAEEILAFNGATAGAANPWGKGKAIIIGSYIGHNATEHKSGASDNFVKKLLELAGVEYAASGGINIRERCANGKKAYILFNAARESKKAILPGGEYIDSYGGKVSGNSIEIEPLDAAAVVFGIV
jgi:beta-galactosidase